GGYSAEYGGRISSIMDIKTRNGNFSRFAAKINANPFTSSALLEGPLFKGKESGTGGGSWLLSARTSYLEQTEKIFYSYVNDTSGLPYSFLDIYGKVTFGSGGDRVSLFGFRQQDKVNFQFPSNINWDCTGGGMNFQFLPSRSNLTMSGNFAYSNYNSGLSSVSEAFPRTSSIGGFNGGLNFNFLLNSVNELIYGVELLGFRTDFKFTNAVGLITQQTFNNTEAAGFIKYKQTIRKVTELNGEKHYFTRLVLEPSLRVHYFNDHSFLSIEPRFRAKLNFKKVSFNISAGQYYQNLVAATSDRDVVVLFQGYLAAPSDAANLRENHPLQSAQHIIVGTEIDAATNLQLQVEGWYKNFSQVTNINRDKLFPTDPNFITETGQAYGADITAKYATKKLYLYATYGLAYVRRNDGKREYFTVFDRRHTANLIAAYKTGEFDGTSKIAQRFKESKWEFSLRWTLGSGFPFTQTQGFFEKLDFNTINNNGSQSNVASQNGSLGILLSDELNTGRLPYFHRLDLAVKRRFIIADKFLLEANISIFNAYNRSNIFYFDRVRYARVNQLPLLPSAGISLSF
ncbi:MAG: TonB-dependent receptor, partial [Bacteroidia bacterium]|nr:TonB-dependent receptor [Bacteroidia bacterium]